MSFIVYLTKLRAEETQTEAAEPVDTSVVNVSETTPLSKSDPSTPVKVNTK